jgi:hypothetical protein
MGFHRRWRPPQSAGPWPGRGRKCGIDTGFGQTQVRLGRGLRSGMTFGPRMSTARGGGDIRGPTAVPRRGLLAGLRIRGASGKLSWIRGAPGELVGKLMGLAELRMTGRQNRKRKKGREGGGSTLR